MSSRRESLRRVKKLNKITRGRDFSRDYHWEYEEESTGSAGAVIIAIVTFAVIVALVGVVFLYLRGRGSEDLTTGDVGGDSVGAVTGSAVDAEPEATPTAPPVAYEPEVESMPQTATFLQGPKAWKNKADWSGYWGDLEIDGRRFGSFGCGLCCMASFYTTITPYQCSPMDMYKYSKKNSSYEGAGAIDWPHIQTVMEKLGFTVDTGRRPKKYEKFQKLVSEAEATMVVVSSNYDDSFWKDTPGHYVTLWGYNPTDDTVFLGDSGSDARNRQWISLRTVYDAIKRSNTRHYMRMLSYDEAKDKWKHKTISGDWCQPAYWSK